MISTTPGIKEPSGSMPGGWTRRARGPFRGEIDVLKERAAALNAPPPFVVRFSPWLEEQLCGHLQLAWAVEEGVGPCFLAKRAGWRGGRERRDAAPEVGASGRGSRCRARVVGFCWIRWASIGGVG